TVDFLDFVHQVSLQFLFAKNGQDVMRVERTIHKLLARFDALALLHVHVDAPGNRVFLLGSIVGYHVYFALSLAHLTELYRAIDFANDCGFMRFASFEQFHHARQTACDVLGLCGLTRDLGKHISRKHLVPSATIRCAREGIRYRLLLLPLMTMAG